MPVITDDLIGKPFQDGGRGPDGYDCWGLAKEIFRRHGIELPDYQICCEDASRIASEIDTQRPGWIRCDSLPPTPSLVVMRYGSKFCNHTGVYLGYGQFIHTRESIGVNIDRIESPNWRHRIEGIYRPGWVRYDNINDLKKSVSYR
jgi:cell wall-associated NlpC family hydrolase